MKTLQPDLKKQLHYTLKNGESKTIDFNFKKLHWLSRQPSDCTSIRFNNNIIISRKKMKEFISILSEFKGLETLDFGCSNNLREALETIDLGGNKVGIKQLQNKLPGCKIRFQEKKAEVYYALVNTPENSQSNSDYGSLTSDSESDSSVENITDLSLLETPTKQNSSSLMIDKVLQQESSNDQGIVSKQKQCKGKTYGSIAGVCTGLATACFVVGALNLTSYVAIGAVFIGMALAGSIIACSITKLCENKVKTKVDNLNATPHNLQGQVI
ncbi:MAG: hypothetical protein KTV77_01255 [Wolbachia endosymbiont of Fragariocoptes setiger]|nr:hypothetical protein [Wolbachia endosymbiont of Fragariocoptes setiger]